MAKILKRTGADYLITDTGQTVPANGQLVIDPSNYSLFAKSDDTIAALASGALVYNDGSADLSLADATIHLQGSYPSYVGVSEQPPFAVKTFNGKKLYKRVHGVKQTVAVGQTVDIFLVVPYDQCKITAVDIVGGKLGDTCDFEVYDTPTGTLSTIPNLMLNQFGFNVNVAPGFYREESSYDADLIKDMKLEVRYTNNGVASVEIGVNFVLHELKP